MKVTCPTCRVLLMLPLLLSMACDKQSPESSPKTGTPASQMAPNPAEKHGTPAASKPKQPDVTKSAETDSSSDATSGVPQIDVTRLTESQQKQIHKARQRVLEAPGSASRICELGMQYLALGFPDAAASCFSKAIELLPSAMQYHYLRGLAHQAGNKTDAAEKDFRTCIKLNAAYVPAYVNLAGILAKRGDDSACELFEQALKLDAKDVVALHGLAECRMRVGDDASAETLLKRALEIQPDDADAHLALSQLYHRTGNDAEAAVQKAAAEKGTKPIVANDPLAYEVVRRSRNESDIARKALNLAKSGDVDQAAKYLESAIDAGIDGSPIREALGGIYLAKHLPKMAIVQFRAGLDKSPKSSDLRSGLARALAETGQLDEAEKIFKQIIAENPDDAVTMNRLGMLYGHRNQADKAEPMLRKAIEADPNCEVCRLNLADLLINTGRPDEAKQLLSSIAESSPNIGKKRFLDGLIDARAGRLDDARQDLQKAIKATPDLAEAYAALAEISLKDGKTSDALATLMDGIKNAPNAANLKNNAAWILATSPDDSIRNGQLAVELAESAVELDQNRHDNYAGTLAAAYAEAGRFDEAVHAAQRAAKMARDAGLDRQAAQHEARAALYEQGKPYRTPSKS